MVLPLPGAWPGGLPCPWNRGTVDAVACRETIRGKRWSQRSRPLIRLPSGLGSGAGLVGGACGWGRACQEPSGQIPPPWAWRENEAPAARAARRLVSGRLVGLFQDPADVVGATIDDRNGDDAGHLVGVLPLGAVHDLRKEAAPGAQGNTALGRVVDLAVPAVDGADGREVVAGGAQPVVHQPAGELDQPVWIGRGDDDLTDLIGCWGHPAPSTRPPAPWRRPRSGPCCSSR